MKMHEVFYVVAAFLFVFFLSSTESYAYPEYCPGGTASCVDCHGVDYCSKCPSDPTCSASTTWTITAAAGAGGTISPSGAVTVNGGTNQQFTITPYAGYEINNVIVDDTSLGSLTSYIFSNVIADHSISASFIQPTGPPPVADFSFVPLTATDPYIVSFTDLSTDNPDSWLWDFGDGTTSSQQNPNHAYLSQGTFTVTLQVSNRNGINLISQNLDASFAPCPNDPVDLNGWRQTSIQTAYDNAADGEVIKIQASDFNEDLIFDRNITVTLSGGHDCSFSINPAMTIVPSGSLTVAGGTLMVENLIIQSVSSTLDGAGLYGQYCTDCHGSLAVSEKIPTTTTAVQAAIDGNTGNMGILNFLTPAEVQAIVSALNEQTPPPQSCTSCHGQPPSGNSFPDTAGAHPTHSSLGFGSTVPSCGACHAGSTHLNGIADLGFPTVFNAQSGPATANLDSTCSSVKCHGGQTTPDWWTGSLNVDTDCTACHTRRTSGDSFPDQYNDYYSGRHRDHVRRSSIDCWDCHNRSILQTGHFSNLETSAFEQDPADTIGGSGTSVGSYNGSTCSNIQCHGSESW